jgi:GNAT superfamily N-acetyltransferase
MDATTQLYEELSLNSFPALQTQLYDGWILRYANGFGNRAHSVSPLYPSTLDLLDKIRECENRYAQNGNKIGFKLTGAADPKIDRTLDGMGYVITNPTYVMSMPITDHPQSPDCSLSDRPDDGWFNTYFATHNYTSELHKSTVKQIAINTILPAKYATLTKNNRPVAYGSLVVERGYMALLNLVVDETHRGRGFGWELSQSLLSAAKATGAHTAYLQVMQNNAPAVNLYAKLGYKTIYTYHYRVKEFKR